MEQTNHQRQGGQPQPQEQPPKRNTSATAHNIEVLRAVLDELATIQAVIKEPQSASQSTNKAQIQIQACIFLHTGFKIIGITLQEYKHPAPTAPSPAKRNCSRLVSMLQGAVLGFCSRPKPKTPVLYKPLYTLVANVTECVLYALEVAEHRRATSARQKELQQAIKLFNAPVRTP